MFRVSSWDVRFAAKGESLSSQDHKTIPASVRRRLNSFGRDAGTSIADKIESSPLIVFASRYGDAVRSVDILEEICKGEEISPMNFSLSVHNAVSGLFSIGWKLKQMQSVISAGANTFVMGLTEAFSLLKSFPDEDVLLIYVDVPLPSVFSEFDDAGEATEICALLMSRDNNGKTGPTIEANLIQDQSGKLQAEDHPLQALAALLQGTNTETTVGNTTFGWELKNIC